jgi:hypothetical protein
MELVEPNFVHFTSVVFAKSMFNHVYLPQNLGLRHLTHPKLEPTLKIQKHIMT